jgi:DNA-binding NarL/FixJ family response regulator
MGIRVIIADDQPEVRSALRLLLEENPEISVVSEVENARELLAEMATPGPDLLLLDWELPGSRPEKLMASLSLQSPQTSIIALSSHPQMKKTALAAGVKDFICKSEPPEKLLSLLEKFIPE